MLNRRSFVATAAIAAETLRGATLPIPIIDTHIHFFDTTRAQGVPYGEGFPVGPLATPAVYRKTAVPLGVVGAIEVEASPWIEDNFWVLEVSQADPIMVGVIGNLEPDKPDFPEYLERCHRHPLFLGIRCGDLWGHNLAKDIAKQEFVSGLRRVAEAKLIMDTANPSPELLEACLHLTDKVPDLRVMIDHLPGMEFPEEPGAERALEATLRELAKRDVYVKGSVIARRVNGVVQTASEFYKARLDLIWNIFGEDRVVFGSDWPNSTGNWVSYEQSLAIVMPYVRSKGTLAAEKYFWRNSVSAYRWKKRSPEQPG